MTKRYAVHNLRCAGCAARIEDAIAGLPGVKSAAINLDSARLRVEGEQPELAAMIRLADAIEPGTLFSEMDENEPLPESSEPQPSLFRSEYKLWIAAALFAVGMIFEERLDALLTPFVAKAVFFGIPYLLCGLSVLKKGLQSLHNPKASSAHNHDRASGYSSRGEELKNGDISSVQASPPLPSSTAGFRN